MIWNSEDKDLQCKAQGCTQGAREEMQDVLTIDAAGDLASDRATWVPLSRDRGTPTLRQAVGSHVQRSVSTTSPERPFASHVTSSYRLLMQPLVNQHASMVPGHHACLKSL